MQEIARAIQEGAAAYLRKQYTTIAVVAIVPFLAARLLQQARLGDGDRLPDRRGPLGRGRLHRHERRRALERPHRRGRASEGLQPALNVAFRAGSVTGLLVVGLGLLGVAGYYWRPHRAGSTTRQESAIDDLDRARLRRLADLGLRATRRRHLHEGRRRRRRPRRQDRGRHPRGRPAQPGRDRRQRRRQRRRLRRHGGRPVRDLRRHRGRRDAARDRRSRPADLWLYPLALGGISILASVIGTFFARVGTRRNSIINALYKSVIVATVLSALGFIPVTMAFDDGRVQLLATSTARRSSASASPSCSSRSPSTTPARAGTR